MRVLIVSTDYPPDIGGVQTYAYEMAQRIAPKCDHFAVITVNSISQSEARPTDSFPVYRVGSSANLFSLRVWRLVAYLGRKENFDTVLCTSWPSAAACFIARFMGGPSRIFSAAHGRELSHNPAARVPVLGPLYNWIRRFIIRNTIHGFFPVSRFTENLLRELGVPTDKMCVVNNGTDPEIFFPDDSNDAATFRRNIATLDRKIILTLGRLVRRKGVDVVINAMPSILARIPNALYVVVGQGPELTSLQRLSKQKGVEGSVMFIDENVGDRLRKYYNSCDVFVLPARDIGGDVEGFGIVFLEASACRKPVIGTTSGGIPDAIQDGKTGILVPPDSPDQLADVIVDVLSDSALAERLGNSGRVHVVKDGNWKTASEKLFQALTDVSA